MKTLISIILLHTLLTSFGQSPKREFRGVWIATVKNIDWPSKPGLSSAIQKDEFRQLLDYHKLNGMNAAIVQIRPSADAFYFSEKESWSRYLTGESGLAPDSYYDPLTFMIEETHARGLEFHAWFNPYRIIVDLEEMPEDSTHILYQHPDWFVQYGDRMYFDPGLPEAKSHVVEIIKDVTTRYDIDAIHFDDYFYPYRIAGEEFPDSVSFAKYGEGYTPNDIGDWRRENVNSIIKALNDTIKSVKPYVKFGISPFAVWRSKKDDPRGSDTEGTQTNYDDLYADVLKWMDEGWIDYVLPQIYFSNEHTKVPFDKMYDWWSRLDYSGHIYIGHGAYRVGGKREAWKSGSEIPRQIRKIRREGNTKGSAFFSSKSLINNPMGIADSLRFNEYKHYALIPRMSWLDSISPGSPFLEVKAETKGNLLKWVSSDSTSKYFVIYRFRKKEKVDIEDAGSIIEVLNSSRRFYLDRSVARRKKYTYVVTSLDRLFNESEASNHIQVRSEIRNK